MKYLVVSDIHGSSESSLKIKEIFLKEKCDKILCLGDILYHGPRNDLPLAYNPKQVIKDLNELSDKIIAVRGNCDAYVDQMVLDFKIMEETYINLGEKLLYLCHGHFLTFDEKDDDILKDAIILYGHYHIPSIKNINNRTYINVGSITLPKENNPKTYAIIDETNILIKDLAENIILNYKL